MKRDRKRIERRDEKNDRGDEEKRRKMGNGKERDDAKNGRIREKMGEVEKKMEEKVRGEEIKKKVEKVLQGKEREGGDLGKREETKERIEGMERKMELREREERKRNIIIKRAKTQEVRTKRKVEKLMKQMVVEGVVEWVKVLAEQRGEEWGKIIWVRLSSERQKREIMKKKKL